MLVFSDGLLTLPPLSWTKAAKPSTESWIEYLKSNYSSKDSEQILSKLPTNYVLYTRASQAHLYGHPSCLPFTTAKDFLPHLIFLNSIISGDEGVTGVNVRNRKRYNDCKCILCPMYLEHSEQLYIALTSDTILQVRPAAPQIYFPHELVWARRTPDSKTFHPSIIMEATVRDSIEGRPLIEDVVYTIRLLGLDGVETKTPGVLRAIGTLEKVYHITPYLFEAERLWKGKDSEGFGKGVGEATEYSKEMQVGVGYNEFIELEGMFGAEVVCKGRGMKGIRYELMRMGSEIVKKGSVMRIKSESHLIILVVESVVNLSEKYYFIGKKYIRSDRVNTYIGGKILGLAWYQVNGGKKDLVDLKNICGRYYPILGTSNLFNKKAGQIAEYYTDFSSLDSGLVSTSITTFVSTVLTEEYQETTKSVKRLKSAHNFEALVTQVIDGNSDGTSEMFNTLLSTTTPYSSLPEMTLTEYQKAKEAMKKLATHRYSRIFFCPCQDFLYLFPTAIHTFPGIHPDLAKINDDLGFEVQDCKLASYADFLSDIQRVFKKWFSCNDEGGQLYAIGTVFCEFAMKELDVAWSMPERKDVQLSNQIGIWLSSWKKSTAFQTKVTNISKEDTIKRFEGFFESLERGSARSNGPQNALIRTLEDISRVAGRGYSLQNRGYSIVKEEVKAKEESPIPASETPEQLSQRWETWNKAKRTQPVLVDDIFTQEVKVTKAVEKRKPRVERKAALYAMPSTALRTPKVAFVTPAIELTLTETQATIQALPKAVPKAAPIPMMSAMVPAVEMAPIQLQVDSEIDNHKVRKEDSMVLVSGLPITAEIPLVPAVVEELLPAPIREQGEPLSFTHAISWVPGTSYVFSLNHYISANSSSKTKLFQYPLEGGSKTKLQQSGSLICQKLMAREAPALILNQMIGSLSFKDNRNEFRLFIVKPYHADYSTSLNRLREHLGNKAALVSNTVLEGMVICTGKEILLVLATKATFRARFSIPLSSN